MKFQPKYNMERQWIRQVSLVYYWWSLWDGHMFHRLTSMATCLYLLCLSSATTQWKQYQACHFLWCCFSEKQLYQPLQNPPWAKPIPSIDIYVSSIEIKNPLAHGISSCFKSRKCIVILKKKGRDFSPFSILGQHSLTSLLQSFCSYKYYYNQE